MYIQYAKWKIICFLAGFNGKLVLYNFKNYKRHIIILGCTV